MSKQAPQKTSIVERMVKPVLKLPRALRVVICALFALATALVLTPLIDLIYTELFFSPTTVIVPALVSTGFGMLMYLLGWWLLVGTAGEDLEPRPAMAWYLGIGMLVIVLALVLFITGLNMLEAPIM